LRLTAADLPTEGEEKKRKVVVIHEVEELPPGITPQLSDPLARLKQGLAWLYKQKMGTAVLDVLKQLAVQINELERLSTQPDGEIVPSAPQQVSERPEPPLEPSVLDQLEEPIATPVMDQPATPVEDRVEDEPVTPVEEQVVDQVEMESEPQIDIAERLPSPPEVGEEVKSEAALPSENAFQSGLLRKHLDTKPQKDVTEVEAVADEGVEEAQIAKESDEALETLEEIFDGEMSAQGEDQLAIGEDFFEDLEKELPFDDGDGVLDLSDTPIEEPVPSPPTEGSKKKDSSWPPQRPSEMNDFEEYK
jgi:hypothetical protein